MRGYQLAHLCLGQTDGFQVRRFLGDQTQRDLTPPGVNGNSIDTEEVFDALAPGLSIPRFVRFISDRLDDLV